MLIIRVPTTECTSTRQEHDRLLIQVGTRSHNCTAGQQEKSNAAQNVKTVIDALERV